METGTGLDNVLKTKKSAKIALAKTLGFDCKKLLLGIFLDKNLTKKKELEIVSMIVDGIKAVNIEVVLLADKNINTFGKSAHFLSYNRKNRHDLLQAVDLALAFDFSDVEEMLLNGVIPVCRKRNHVEDYDPNHETGNGFVYHDKSHWGVFAALVRASETFKFPYDWKHIVKQGVYSVKKNLINQDF